MISPELYTSSSTYDFFLKLLGYEKSIDRFLHSLELDCAEDCRVLDAGCGTGLLGLHFLQRFEQSSLVATDLEPNFLSATLANAAKRNLDQSRITVGTADIARPGSFTTLDGQTDQLPAESFDVICVGAVVGYSPDTESSLQQLLNLLAVGGYLINIEMNESPTGRYVAKRFHYDNISLNRMCEVMATEGCQVDTQKLKLSHLPARLTRQAVIARKRS